MTILNAILDAQTEAQQLTIDDYLALEDLDPGDVCDVQHQCRQLMGVGEKYVCGYIGAGTTHFCKRKKLLSTEVKDET